MEAGDVAILLTEEEIDLRAPTDEDYSEAERKING